MDSKPYSYTEIRNLNGISSAQHCMHELRVPELRVP